MIGAYCFPMQRKCDHHLEIVPFGPPQPPQYFLTLMTRDPMYLENSLLRLKPNNMITLLMRRPQSECKIMMVSHDVLVVMQIWKTMIYLIGGIIQGTFTTNLNIV